MSGPELKRCPFCGANVRHETGKRVVCDKCACSGPWENGKREAIAAWNRRALPAVVPMGWLSFDSAPRDGSRFLAMGGGLEAVDICSYNARVGCWDCGAVTLDDTDHEPEGYNRRALWVPLSVLALIAKEAAR